MYLACLQNRYREDSWVVFLGVFGERYWNASVAFRTNLHP